jgi:hypothetical protein
VHLACVRSALGHLVLELVELTEDLDRDADFVVVKAAKAGRIVQQHVGIQHKCLHTRYSSVYALAMSLFAILHSFLTEGRHLEFVTEEGWGGGTGSRFAKHDGSGLVLVLVEATASWPLPGQWRMC